MSPDLTSGDVFLYDDPSGHIRFLPLLGRDANGSSGVVRPGTVISPTFMSHFARKLGEFPETRIEYGPTGLGSFSIFVRRPPSRAAFDESVSLVIACEDIPTSSDIRELCNGSGSRILAWVLEFFVHAEPNCSMKKTEIIWKATLPPRMDARI